MALYLFQQKYLLDRYINPRGDFFDEIGFSHKYFNHKMPMHHLDIIKIIVYHTIIKKELDDKHETYTNKKLTM